MQQLEFSMFITGWTLPCRIDKENSKTQADVTTRVGISGVSHIFHTSDIARNLGLTWEILTLEYPFSSK